MFIYKLPTVEKLLQICKSRDYVKNNPNLCHLLENPLLKDDTELAIQYNEYKAGKPGAGEKFVDYFFTHGPELDTNTLITWRDIIKGDPELNDYGQRVNIVNVQKEKKKLGLVSDLFDCLSNPCQYLSPLSTSLGCLADTTSKYNLKNTGGNDSVISLIDIPEEMYNKIPRQLLAGMSQLTTMISEQMSNITSMIEKHENASKEDPYAIQRAELFGSDVLADIATRFGDCFRIFEFQKRYNPYNPSMNKSTASPNGTVIYDKYGNPRTVSPNGNTIHTLKKADVFSDNRRTVVMTKVEDIASYNIQDTDAAGFIPFGITAYGAMLTATGEYYSDSTTDPGTDAGEVSVSKFRVLPNNYKARTNANLDKLTNGVATTTSAMLKYYQSLIKSKFSSYVMPQNISSLLNNARKNGHANVLIKFPNSSKVISLPVIDCNGNGIGTGLTVDGIAGKGGAPSSYIMPWVDITAQFFLTSDGINCGSLYSARTGEKINTQVKDSISSTDLANATDAGRIKSCLSITNGNQNALARFILSEDFCATNGLDPNIFANIPGNFDNNNVEEAVDVSTAISNGEVKAEDIGGF